jgi:AraC-like DNA-binding protein
VRDVAEVSAAVLRPEDPGPRPFRVDRVDASGPLAAVVQNFWSVQWALPAGREHEQEVVTHPCSHVTVEDGLAWVQGVVVHRFSRRLVGSGHAVGARLRPAGLSALTDVPPATLTGRRVPATEVLGDVRELVEAVERAPDAVAGMAAFERWLAARDPRPPDGATLVDEAVELAAADRELTRVDELAAALGVPVRTLQRRFDRHLGVGPKWVLRRCRIQGALAEIEAGREMSGVDWADLAVRLGFADQSHFVNSFTALVGVPPGQYTSRAPLAERTGD